MSHSPDNLGHPYIFPSVCVCVCVCVCARVCAKLLQSRLTLCNLGLQPARLLCPCGFSRQEYWSGWFAVPSSRGSSPPRDQTHVSMSPALAGGSLPLVSRGKPHFLSAAAAKSFQSCLTLCDPRDGSPPGSPIPGILQARTLEWVAISFSNA